MIRPKAKHLAITPDGPRGPRRVVQDGVAYLASRSRIPLVAMGVASDNPWRAGSWDRMALPKPFSQARIVLSEPIEVPRKLRRDDLVPWRERAHQVLDDTQRCAERLAAGVHVEALANAEGLIRCDWWRQ